MRWTVYFDSVIPITPKRSISCRLDLFFLAKYFFFSSLDRLKRPSHDRCLRLHIISTVLSCCGCAISSMKQQCFGIRPFRFRCSKHAKITKAIDFIFFSQNVSSSFSFFNMPNWRHLLLSSTIKGDWGRMKSMSRAILIPSWWRHFQKKKEEKTKTKNNRSSIVRCSIWGRKCFSHPKRAIRYNRTDAGFEGSIKMLSERGGYLSSSSISLSLSQNVFFFVLWLYSKSNTNREKREKKERRFHLLLSPSDIFKEG